MMLGKNQTLPQQLNDGQSLHVQEVFYTLQGEGTFSGRPALFIRLSGCNLSCYWCDTDFESSKWQPSLDELLREAKSLVPPHCNLAVISGGEPFRQNIGPLVQTLLAENFIVQIETNGTLWTDLPEDDRINIVCSPKTAYVHPEIYRRAHSFKYVVAAGAVDSADGLPGVSAQQPGVECRVA
ncbi:MAG: 7-carboxy-7-deazaguanine synthase QueE, partial [Terriglobales bacterium]